MTLSNTEIARARASQEALFRDVVVISRHSSEADGYGGQIEDYRNIATGVKARLAVIERGRGNIDLEERGDRINEDSTRMLTLAFDQDILTRDRVEHDGVTYEVVGINDGNSYRTAKRVRLRRIE
tara:strand:+ start:7895 stop:8269 length:375 start_codon:yes stop_codon:yes gene_type:complete